MRGHLAFIEAGIGSLNQQFSSQPQRSPSGLDTLHE
jgi:hypothetical protein